MEWPSKSSSSYFGCDAGIIFLTGNLNYVNIGPITRGNARNLKKKGEMKKLLLSIGLLCLVGTAAVTYATCQDSDGYKCYLEDDYSKSPQGDCLEMICEHGCVENSEFEGHCCEAPKEGLDCREDVYKDGCLIETKKSCGDKEYCDADGQCKEKKECTPACNECQMCDFEKNQCKTDTSKNGTLVGDCGKCNSGRIINNTSVKAPECKKCDTTSGSPTQWQWINDDNKVIGDCGKCVGGTVGEDTSKKVPTCKKCDNVDSSSTRWKLVADDTNVVGLNACQKCQNGNVQYKDYNKTSACNGWCCPTGYTCGWGMNQCIEPCAGYASNACPQGGICDCCPTNNKRCNLVSCQDGYVHSGNSCVPNPCNGYPLWGCPTNAICSGCLSGNSWKYQSTGCRNGYSLSYDGSCRDQCSDYPMTSCGYCQECVRCPYNSNRFRQIGCSRWGNCCRANNGACVNCAKVWHPS